MIKKLDVPIKMASVELTERCNLRCGYCFSYGRGRKDLAPKKGRDIIDWLLADEVSHGNPVEITWWGGEPFVKFDLMRELTEYAVRRAESMGKTISIGGTTNATLLNKEAVDWMCQTRAYFMLSVDGIGKDQDINRSTATGKSSWKLIEQNLPYVVEKIPFIKTRMSLAPNTIHNMLHSIKTLHEQFKINSITFSPVYEMDWTDENIHECEKQFRLTADYIVSCRKRGEELSVKHLDEGAGKIKNGHKQLVHPCGAGRGYVGISTEGIIYPCHRFHKFGASESMSDAMILGNIDVGIINPELRDKFINSTSAPYPTCGGCEWKQVLCDMPCYAIAYDLTGDILTVPPLYCRLWKIQSDAAKYFHEQLIANNLSVFSSSPNTVCTCDNMCYAEGTDKEIITINRGSQATCICNNVRYDGRPDEQARPLAPNELSGQIKKIAISTPGEQMLRRLIEQMDRQAGIDTDLVAAINRLSDAIEMRG